MLSRSDLNEIPQVTPICRSKLLKGGNGNGRPKAGVVEKPQVQRKLKDDGKRILCRQCRQVITGASERIAVQGAHEHTFANPHGLVYQIGCFRSVTGCGHTGPLTAEWSWFDGFSWRIALCGSCLVQLGWLFVSGGGERFHGLIFDRLLFSEGE